MTCAETNLTRLLNLCRAILDRPAGEALAKLKAAIDHVVTQHNGFTTSTGSQWAPLLAQAARIVARALVAGDQGRVLQAGMNAGALIPMVEADREKARLAPPHDTFTETLAAHDPETLGDAALMGRLP
jgi:hypothetical protein